MSAINPKYSGIANSCVFENCNSDIQLAKTQTYTSVFVPKPYLLMKRFYLLQPTYFYMYFVEKLQ